MGKTERQRGGIIIIVISLICALGVVVLGLTYYKNYIANKNSSKNQTQTDEQSSSHSSITEQLSFNGSSYEIKHAAAWEAKVTKNDPAAQNGSKVTITSPSKKVRATVEIRGSAPDGACDRNDGLKIRYYAVSPSSLKLTADSLFVVESMSDRKDGGYEYSIGITQEGGDVHASLGESHCNIAHVGEAQTFALGDDQKLVRPTILAKIDFPKLSGLVPSYAREMQPVKDLLKTDEYTTALKVLESLKKK